MFSDPGVCYEGLEDSVSWSLHFPDWSVTVSIDMKKTVDLLHKAIFLYLNHDFFIIIILYIYQINNQTSSQTVFEILMKLFAGPVEWGADLRSANGT